MRGAWEHVGHAPGVTDRARRLRADMTLSEKRLWARLRKLDLGFRRQAPVGRFVLDFVSHRARLAVEVDGPFHDFEEARRHDARRDGWLQSQGYRVLRVRDDAVLADPDRVVAEVLAALTAPFTEQKRLDALHASKAARDGLRVPQALPLDGGGLGGGGAPISTASAGEAISPQSSFPRHPAPPTPPPSRGRGDSNRQPSTSMGEGWVGVEPRS